MPIYEYKCEKCNNIQKEMHKIKENKLIKCIKCNNKTKKIISKNNFILKGKGWYKTDYK